MPEDPIIAGANDGDKAIHEMQMSKCKCPPGLIAPMTPDLQELRLFVGRLRSVCAEAYQMAGALGAPGKALDNLSAAASGNQIPHETFLPVEPRDERAERLEQLLRECREALETALRLPYCGCATCVEAEVILAKLREAERDG